MDGKVGWMEVTVTVATHGRVVVGPGPTVWLPLPEPPTAIQAKALEGTGRAGEEPGWAPRSALVSPVGGEDVGLVRRGKQPGALQARPAAHCEASWPCPRSCPWPEASADVGGREAEQRGFLGLLWLPGGRARALTRDARPLAGRPAGGPE